MDWDSLHGRDFRSNLGKLTYNPRPVKIFELGGLWSAPPGSIQKFDRIELLTDDDVFQWLDKQGQTPSTMQSHNWSLTILATERAPPNEFELAKQPSSGPSLIDIGLSNTNFKQLFKDFRIAKSFLYILQYNQSVYTFGHPEIGTNNYPFLSFNLRTTPVLLHDKSMTVRHDSGSATTFVLLLGCSSDDVDQLYDYLHTMQRYGGHPLLMVALFLDMSYRDLREQYFELRSQNVLLSKAVFHQQQKELDDYRNKLAQTSQQYELHLTEEAELTALRLRLVRFIQNMKYVNDNSSGPDEKKKYMAYHGGRMMDRLHTMVSDIEYLQSKCASQKEGLQLLISSMNSIVSVAESKIARQISIASKRDSSAMMAIAVGTMLFLPLTAMASIFAMPFLPWNAQQGDNPTGHPLLIYLTLSLPLTAVTLITLMLWLWAVDYEAESSHTTLKPEARKLLLKIPGTQKLWNHIDLRRRRGAASRQSV